MTNEPLMIAGMDVLYTKIAVDFQNLADDGFDETVLACLERLREASKVDSVFLALFGARGPPLIAYSLPQTPTLPARQTR